MASSSSRAYPQAHAESSSSRSSPPRQPTVQDGDSDDEGALLSADPLDGELGAG
jgi:hypothetical protein